MSEIRTCRECRQPFRLTDAEIQRLHEIAQRDGGVWSLPKTCLQCRKAIRDARGAGLIGAEIEARWYEIECVECGSVFLFAERRRWREANQVADASKDSSQHGG